MKNRGIFILAMIFFAFPLVGQQQPGNAPAGAAPDAPGKTTPKDETKSYLKVLTLDDFEESEDWRAKATCPVGTTKTLKMVQRGPIQSADNPEERPPEGPGKEQCNVNKPECAGAPNHILGVKTHFMDQGFDRVEVLPPNEYVIKGMARQFSIWALGRKFRHTMSIKLKDYKGKIHKLPLGRLDYFGWRKLVVTIPGWLPQSSRFSTLDKNLHFMGIFVTSDPKEVYGDFYFYIDNLKVLVDKSDSNYPGSEISDNW